MRKKKKPTTSEVVIIIIAILISLFVLAGLSAWIWDEMSYHFLK